MNLYFTEDQDLEKAIKILNLPIRIRLIGEASHMNNFTLKNFFRFRGSRKTPRKKWKRF